MTQSFRLENVGLVNKDKKLSYNTTTPIFNKSLIALIIKSIIYQYIKWRGSSVG